MKYRNKENIMANLNKNVRWFLIGYRAWLKEALVKNVSASHSDNNYIAQSDNLAKTVLVVGLVFALFTVVMLKSIRVVAETNVFADPVTFKTSVTFIGIVTIVLSLMILNKLVLKPLQRISPFISEMIEKGKKLDELEKTVATLDNL